MVTMATATAVPSSISLKRPVEDYLDTVAGDNKTVSTMALLSSLAQSGSKKLRLDKRESEDERESLEGSPRKPHMMNGALGATAAHRGFPCVWLDGSVPNREQEGGEKSPNPPPPQLALPLETEGASTERSLHLSPATSKHLQSTPLPPMVITPMKENAPPRNPFEDRPGMEHLFKSNTSGNHSDGDSSIGDGDSNAVEVCPECHKVFKRKVYLQRHMEREHWSTAKVFKCEDCSYETKHQSNLSVHRRTHTGERPYHCGCCGQRYTQGHLLKSHIRSRHGGNMEFYNLDKKSESTRGRKSLDLKHDSPLSAPKVDKISALLQAAAATNGQGQHPLGAPPSPMGHKFGGLLPPPMGSFPYFGAGAGGLRPAMMNPGMSLANSLLGGPRFFSLSGFSMPESLLAGSGLPMISSGHSPSSVRPLNLGLPPVSMALSPSRAQITEVEDRPAKPPAKSPPTTAIKMPMQTPERRTTPPRMEDTAQDLSVKKPSNEEEATPEPRRALPSEPEPPVASSPSSALFNGYMNGTTVAPQSSESARSTPMTRPPTECDESVSEEDPPSPVGTENDEDVAHYNFLQPAMRVPGKCRHGNRKQDDICPHLKKLQSLRRNVFRMLSTFTPDLNEENGITNDGDEVDELLHEVIYSNIDDDFMAAKD